MAILSKGNTFATGDQVTALKLNNLVDSATFASGAVDDSTTQLNGSGQIIVKDSGITSAKLNLSATGASQNIATFKTTQTNDSGTFNRALNIRTPASTTDLNSPFEITTGNGIKFICDDHTVIIDSDGKVGIGTGTPSSILDITQASGVAEINLSATQNDAVLSLNADTDEGSDSQIHFNAGTSTKGKIVYDHNTTAGNQAMIFSAGDIKNHKNKTRRGYLGPNRSRFMTNGRRNFPGHDVMRILCRMVKMSVNE